MQVINYNTYFFLLGDLLVCSSFCRCFSGVTSPISMVRWDLVGVTGACMCSTTTQKMLQYCNMLHNVTTCNYEDFMFLNSLKLAMNTAFLVFLKLNTITAIKNLLFF